MDNGVPQDEPVMVRRATVQDIDAIATISVASWQATYSDAIDADTLASLTPAQRKPTWQGILQVDNHPTTVLVAEQHGAVVGYCSFGPPPEEEFDLENCDELYSIYLQPGHERQGIGTHLMRGAIQEMTRNGRSGAFLWVLQENMGAQVFYASQGWIADGIERQRTLFGIPIVVVRYTKTWS